MRKYLYSIALLIITMLWSCNSETESCSEYISMYELLSPEDEWLFPFNDHRKNMTYLYSNDTLTNDTLVFELDRVEYFDVDTLDEGSCVIVRKEVRRFFYKVTEPVYKKVVIISSGTRISWEDRNRGETFNYKLGHNSNFNVYASGYYNSSPSIGEIKDEYEVNNTTYNRVYVDIDSGCDHPKSYLAYSVDYGFLEIRDSCDHETYKLIK